MKKHRGFTLIEIMLTVGLIGVISTTALAPLVFTVRSLEEAQKRWGVSHNTEYVFDKIFSDARRAVECRYFDNFRIVHKGGISLTNNDRLLIWSKGESVRNSENKKDKTKKKSFFNNKNKQAGNKAEEVAVGLIVYKVVEKNEFNGEKAGFYRWKLVNLSSENSVSGDFYDKNESPIDIDTDKLDVKDAECLMPDATGVKFYAASGSEWIEDYSGSLPRYLRAEIFVKDKSVSRAEKFPNGR